jgi:hypothetical protein
MEILLWRFFSEVLLRTPPLPLYRIHVAGHLEGVSFLEVRTGAGPAIIMTASECYTGMKIRSFLK